MFKSIGKVSHLTQGGPTGINQEVFYQGVNVPCLVISPKRDAFKDPLCP